MWLRLVNLVWFESSYRGKKENRQYVKKVNRYKLCPDHTYVKWIENKKKVRTSSRPKHFAVKFNWIALIYIEIDGLLNTMTSAASKA